MIVNGGRLKWRSGRSGRRMHRWHKRWMLLAVRQMVGVRCPATIHIRVLGHFGCGVGGHLLVSGRVAVVSRIGLSRGHRHRMLLLLLLLLVVELMQLLVLLLVLLVIRLLRNGLLVDGLMQVHLRLIHCVAQELAVIGLLWVGIEIVRNGCCYRLVLVRWRPSRGGRNCSIVNVNVGRFVEYLPIGTKKESYCTLPCCEALQFAYLS